jgi:hypothetical protein
VFLCQAVSGAGPKLGNVYGRRGTRRRRGETGEGQTGRMIVAMVDYLAEFVSYHDGL